MVTISVGNDETVGLLPDSEEFPVPSATSRTLVVGSVLGLRYAIDPDCGLTPEERLVAASDLPTGLGHQVKVVAGALVFSLSYIPGFRCLHVPVDDAQRGVALRSELGSEHVVDLTTDGYGWVRRGRMVDALCFVETVREVGRSTGQQQIRHVLHQLDRMAWHVVRMSATAALLDPQTAPGYDESAENLLAELRATADELVVEWMKHTGAPDLDDETLDRPGLHPAGVPLTEAFVPSPSRRFDLIPPSSPPPDP